MIETTVDFHAELYPPDALERAAAAYAKFAEISIEPRGAYRRAVIRARGEVAADALGRDFANFALAACAVGGAAEPGR